MIPKYTVGGTQSLENQRSIMLTDQEAEMVEESQADTNVEDTVVADAERDVTQLFKRITASEEIP